MFKAIEAFVYDLLGGTAPTTFDDEEMRVACGALLVHAVRIDGTWTSAEDAKLREVLSARYGLSEDETNKLIDTAAEREQDAVDIHRFTRVLYDRLDREGRKEVVGLLWEVTHADGEIDHQERSIVTLIARLLHVEVQDAVALRHSVQKPSE